MSARRSIAALALARTGKTQDDIAGVAGVSRVAVSHWLAGVTKPSPAKREVLAEHFPHIKPPHWDEFPSDKKKEPPSAAPKAAPPPPDGDVFANAAELKSMANELLSSVRSDSRSTPLEKAKVMASIGATLVQVVKLNALVGFHVMRNPVWTRIKKAIETALGPYPEAATALARELRKLDADPEGE